MKHVFLQLLRSNFRCGRMPCSRTAQPGALPRPGAVGLFVRGPLRSPGAMFAPGIFYTL